MGDNVKGQVSDIREKRQGQLLSGGCNHVMEEYSVGGQFLVIPRTGQFYVIPGTDYSSPLNSGQFQGSSNVSRPPYVSPPFCDDSVMRQHLHLSHSFNGAKAKPTDER